MREDQRHFDRSAEEALRKLDIEPREMTLINLGENVTYRVDDSASRRIIALRLHRPGYQSLAELKSEREWVRSLASAGIKVPTPVINAKGEELVSVHGSALSQQRWASATFWLEGTSFDALLRRSKPGREFRLEYFADLGRLLAAMHKQAAAWHPPGNFVRQKLDAEGLMGEKPFMGRFWDHPLLSPAERELLRQTRKSLYAFLRRYGENTRGFGLIHADLNPENIIVNDEQLIPIDFDDAAFGWFMFDIAVALGPLFDEPEYPTYQSTFLAAYRSARELSAQDEALLPTFVMIRRIALLGWYHDRPELPQSARLGQLKTWVCETARGFEPPL